LIKNWLSEPTVFWEISAISKKCRHLPSIAGLFPTLVQMVDKRLRLASFQPQLEEQIEQSKSGLYFIIRCFLDKSDLKIFIQILVLEQSTTYSLILSKPFSLNIDCWLSYLFYHSPNHPKSFSKILILKKTISQLKPSPQAITSGLLFSTSSIIIYSSKWLNC